MSLFCKTMVMIQEDAIYISSKAQRKWYSRDSLYPVSRQRSPGSCRLQRRGVVVLKSYVMKVFQILWILWITHFFTVIWIIIFKSGEEKGDTWMKFPFNVAINSREKLHAYYNGWMRKLSWGHFVDSFAAISNECVAIIQKTDLTAFH